MALTSAVEYAWGVEQSLVMDQVQVEAQLAGGKALEVECLKDLDNRFVSLAQSCVAYESYVNPYKMNSLGSHLVASP